MSSLVIVVIHRDLVVTTPKVGIGGVDTEKRAILPWNVVACNSLVDQSLEMKRPQK